MTARRRTALRAVSLAAVAATGAFGVSCSSDAGTSDSGTAGTAGPVDSSPVDSSPVDSSTVDTGPVGSGVPPTDSLTLVAYSSFPTGDTSLNTALTEFTAATGISVDLVIAGDTGTMLSKASLTAGNPEGDVMWGVDNTFLSRAVDDEVFDDYRSPAIADFPAELTASVPNGEATPVDYGDVCVNYDITWFADHDLDVPTSLDDLADPAYQDLLIVENPATSSPGLAFLLATIDEYGDEADDGGTAGWQTYWQALVDNGVEVVDDWTQAYYDRFSASGGPKPLVVSYGSSPPAGVIFGDPPTGAIESTCFRQVEFAGILRGTDKTTQAEQLVDFLVGERFQSELALNLFVYPADPDVELPPEFVQAAVIPSDPHTVDPAAIDANRSTWIDEWTELVTG